MSKPEKVTVSINVKLPGKAEFCHCKISVDFTNGSHAAVEVEQQGDGANADNFTLAWLKSAVDMFQRKSDENLVPDKKH